MSITFALTGNQNCGKTTLFNQLTGSNQHVGNFPGVTVEKKEGIIKKQKDKFVVDLPGIYSISPYTAEEVVTRDFLINDRPDGIINIIDATNIERNLYLSLQIIELGIPMVIALNMMDEIEANGGFIDVKMMSDELGVPVVPISASKNDGIDELVKVAVKTVANGQKPLKTDFCKGSVHRAIHSLAHLIEDHAERKHIPLRFAATKLVEGDEPMIKLLELNQNELDILNHVVHEMETNLGTDREAALADMRYDFITNLCKKAVVKAGQTKEQARSVKIDAVLTHRFFAFPIFIGIMALIFYLTFGVVGAFLSDGFSYVINLVTAAADNALYALDINKALHSLIIDGIFAGVGSVLSFLPTIVILFLFLSILEDSGYMARVAFVMDKVLRKIGLSGRSFVPLIIGFGCSVPAIMATRTLSSERDRKMTILLVPFMSCSAKLPIYAVFVSAFFNSHQALVMTFLYIFGIIMGILSCLLLKGILFEGKPVPFVMELPAYRFPSFKSVCLHMWEKAKDFIVKAFTIIFCATVIIWVLQNFDLHFNMTNDASKSILAVVGGLAAPIFKPLGFGDWRAATALVTGLTAKEAVVSTIQMLTGEAGLASVFTTPLCAFSFLIFTLLYMPCVAAMAAIRREFNSTLKSVYMMLYQTAFAYAAAFCVYNAGRVMGFGRNFAPTLSEIIIGIVLIVLITAAVLYLICKKNSGETDCKNGKICADRTKDSSF